MPPLRYAAFFSLLLSFLIISLLMLFRHFFDVFAMLLIDAPLLDDVVAMLVFCF